MRYYRKEEFSWYSCFVLLIIILIPIIIFWGTRTWKEPLKASDAYWMRVISIEQYRILNMDHLESVAKPSDAYNVKNYSRSVSYTYKCGENCTTTCSGSGKNRSCRSSCSARYCTGYRTEYRVSYQINRWVWDHDEISQNKFGTTRYWPVYQPIGLCENMFGCLREGIRTELFRTVFTRENGSLLEYTAKDIREWINIWELKKARVVRNNFGYIFWDTLQIGSEK